MSKTVGKAFAVDIAALPEMLHFVDILLEKVNLSLNRKTQIKIACDEALTNVIQHAGLSQQDCLKLEYEVTDEGKLRITLIDTGKPFNPLSHPFSEQEIGGNGLKLMKGLIGHIEYQRLANQNRLTFLI